MMMKGESVVYIEFLPVFTKHEKQMLHLVVTRRLEILVPFHPKKDSKSQMQASLDSEIDSRSQMQSHLYPE